MAAAGVPVAEVLRASQGLLWPETLRWARPVERMDAVEESESP